ncbi:MAG: beta-galactosidase trimerization domain-containing protein, partial [Kiritimatiellae bacterium]|nr:beta-galactosidase trimerization domain-containing protein [Kiritimatiellia bacterium]
DVYKRQVLLWTYVFQSGGHAGTIVWESNAMLQTKTATLKPTSAARKLRDVFLELRSGVPRLLQQTDEISSPVAVHYSHASINADFIISVPPRWRSVAAYEPERYPSAQCREAWWKLLEDRGLRPVFISSSQIEAGELQRRGIRVLVLPRSIALSDKEATEIRTFVASGGTLVTDSFVGRMDEHCRERDVGVLDDLLGIRRIDRDRYHASNQRASIDYRAKSGSLPRWGEGPHRAECALIEERIEPVGDALVLGCSEYTDSPIGILRQHGPGRTLLFNCAPLEYLHERRSAGAGKKYQTFFGTIFELAGLKAEAQVFRCEHSDEPLPGWRVFPFRHGKNLYFGLVPDLSVTQDALGAIEGGNSEEDKGIEVTIRFSAGGHVYDAISARYLGRGNTVTDRLDSSTVRLYAVMPYRVRRVVLKVTPEAVCASLQADRTPGEHVLRFDIWDARGRHLPDAGANVVAPGGKTKWKPDMRMPKGGKIVCRDTATGIKATRRL